MGVHIVLPLLLAAGSSGTKQQGNPLTAFLPIVLIGAVFYFLIMRPQQRRARDQRAMTTNLKQGDRVVAAGGIVGTVRRVDDTTISLQVADSVVIKVDKGSISKRLPDA
jgi:preprotein translocase subunit YajC